MDQENSPSQRLADETDTSQTASKDELETSPPDDVPDDKPEPANGPVPVTETTPISVTETTPPLSTEPIPSPNLVTETPPVPAKAQILTNEKKKEDEKLTIYKALAIKLKKELVKSRDEYQKLKDDSQLEISTLKDRVEKLEETLDSERQSSAANIASLESQVKTLKQGLDTSEAELQALQTEFENYRVRASKIMQQTNQMQSNFQKTFEEERYKQLKELNENQEKRISNLEKQLSTSFVRNKELEEEARLLRENLESFQNETESISLLDSKCEALSRENENLKLAIKEYRTKLKEPLGHQSRSNLLISCDQTQEGDIGDTRGRLELDESATRSSTKRVDKTVEGSSLHGDRLEDNSTRLSPSTSIKDESQTTSSSSYDGSTSGYVHIKPTAFEIISRSSVLEDAQNQIDNLTKAYLDSENTNSLLSDQVRALKEEIRRMQRGTERMDLAENLEYLKNIVFKFLSLDNGQIEQKQRLVPVLSTVLKLSPDETAKLTTLTSLDKPSMASSFFKL